jgi:hypothetical protein
VSKPDTHWWRGSAHLDRTGAGPALRRLIDDGHITPDDLAYTEPFTQYILAEDAIRPGVVVHVLAEPVRTETGIRLCRPAAGHAGAWTLTDVEVDKQLRFRWADLSHPVVASVVALVCGFAAVALA